MQNVSKGLSEVSESFGDAGSYVVRSAKRNPLPFVLVGLGVGMLLMSRTSIFGSGNEHSRHKKGNKQGGNNRSGSMLRQAASVGSGALTGAQKTVGNVAGSAYEGVTNAASSAYEGVSGFASSTGEQVSNVARRAHTQYEQTLEENPLAIGAIALAVGAVVGLAIPTTSYENQWMGETRENLVQSVEDAAREALDKVQQVAGEVTKTVREQAQGQG